MQEFPTLQNRIHTQISFHHKIAQYNIYLFIFLCRNFRSSPSAKCALARSRMFSLWKMDTSVFMRIVKDIFYLFHISHP